MQNAVKFKMQGELQKVLIRGNYVMPSNREEAEPVVKKQAPTTPVKRKAHSAQMQSESAKKARQVDVEVNEQEIEKKMTPIKNSFFASHQTARVRKGIQGIVFRFQKGFTCAVRQSASIQDFL